MWDGVGWQVVGKWIITSHWNLDCPLKNSLSCIYIHMRLYIYIWYPYSIIWYAHVCITYISDISTCRDRTILPSSFWKMPTSRSTSPTRFLATGVRHLPGPQHQILGFNQAIPRYIIVHTYICVNIYIRMYLWCIIVHTHMCKYIYIHTQIFMMYNCAYKRIYYIYTYTDIYDV